MRIIINADDFGYDADTVAATISCLDRGALTSATMMAKMPASAAAFDYIRHRPDVSFGVHLTYVCDTVESPVSAPAAIPALVGADGRFLPSNVVRLLALRERIPVAQIARETHAQLALVRDHGCAISHVDSHGHLHKFAPFREALRQVLPRFGIERVRAVQNVYLRRPWRSPTYWLARFWAVRLRRDFRTTDHFFMAASAMDAHWTQQLLGRDLRGIIEVGVHPGSTKPWRAREAAAAEELAALARTRGLELVSWNAV